MTTTKARSTRPKTKPVAGERTAHGVRLFTTAFAAVDPGENSGVAVFTADGELRAAMQGKLADAVEYLRQLNIPCIVEKPQVYPHAPARPNDLITLALRAGMFLGVAAAGSLTVLPREWKGGTDKPIIHRRAIALLGPGERAYLSGLAAALGPKDDDVQDAIALGLYAAGRVDYLRPNG